MRSEIKISIPENVELVIKRLNDYGFEAVIVGGCVRDALLGREANDWDVATSAKPEKLLELFSGDSDCTVPDGNSFRAIPTGLSHGTVTVLSGGVPIEVTTYRVDGGYSDCRRPDSVRFTSSLLEDLARRDFTVNAMAYSPSDRLFDPYGGLLDLDAGIIRCVGSPEKRFSEDALRILRAVRFSSTLGFQIEPSTADALFKLRGMLTKISRERVSSELAKLLAGKGAAEQLIKSREVVEAVIPELCYAVDYNSASEAVGKLNSEGAPTALLLAALLSEIKPEKVYPALRGLRFDKRTCAHASVICAHLGDELPDKISVRRLCSEVGTDAAEEIIRLGMIRAKTTLEASDAPKSVISSDCIKYIQEIRENNECVSVSGLKINGEDLMSLGIKPESIGGILTRLLAEVISENIPNEKGALAFFAENRINAKKSTADN